MASTSRSPSVLPPCTACRYALPAQYDQMRRGMARLWEAQQPVVEAARQELEVGGPRVAGWLAAWQLPCGQQQLVI